MSFFTRLSNGWTIAMTSLKVLNANKELIIFPILSGISMILIIGSFAAAFFAHAGWDIDSLNIAGNNVKTESRSVLYLIMFLFYIVNYFVVVFFNMALMHCARLYFDGEEVSVAKGLQFSVSRIGAIFSWAVFAATVGMILKIIQDKAGALGKIVTGIIGIVWSIATFFVIPILAYEKLSPMEAVKRSTQMMKDKWGETIGANFSIGIVSFLGIICIAAVAGLIAIANLWVGIAIFVVGFLAVVTISSALHSIFISAVYNNINGNLNDHFDQQLLDDLFVPKG